MREPLVIVFGCDINYAPHLAATMMSVLANGGDDSFAFYVIQQGLDAGTRAQFEAMLAPYCNARLAWLDIEIPRAAELKQVGHLTLAAYFRVFIPDLLPATLGRAIYLDSDLIVRASLRPLWEADLRGHALAAVRDPLHTARDVHERYVKLGLPPHAHYFNSGVLVLNLAKWRAEDLTARVAQFAIDHPERISWNDQDALNAILHDDYLALPMEWNFQRRMCRMLPRDLGLSVSAYRRLWRSPRIVHFTEAKPWSYRDGHPFAPAYFRYLRRTPFHAQVRRTWRLGFGTTLGRWLKRLKYRAAVLPPALWIRERIGRAPPPSPTLVR